MLLVGGLIEQAIEVCSALGPHSNLHEPALLDWGLVDRTRGLLEVLRMMRK